MQDPGEPGIPGVTVILFDGHGHELARTVTDADGFYDFCDLRPGEYEVSPDVSCVEIPVGYVVVVPGQEIPPTDLPAVQQDCVVGFLWQDMDGDGWREESEPPLPGVLVTIRAGGRTYQVTTDANGRYERCGLEPYTVVTISVPDGYIWTTPDEALGMVGCPCPGFGMAPAPGEIPEPGTLVLFGSGLAALAGALRRRRRRS